MTKSKKILIVVLLLPFLLFTYATLTLYFAHKANDIPFSYQNGGTDLTFESSDGAWSGSEDLMGGRDFIKVVIDFELYKIRADKPNITLLRTKPRKKPWQWAWWFDDYDEAKWKVPYAEKTQLNNGDSYSSLLEAATDEEKAAAVTNANRFISILNSKE